jgi:hypothetical protein
MDDYEDKAWNTPEDMEAAAWTVLLGALLLIALAAAGAFLWFAWPVLAAMAN